MSLYQAQYREVDTTRKAPRLRERLIRAKNYAEYYTKNRGKIADKYWVVIVTTH